MIGLQWTRGQQVNGKQMCEFIAAWWLAKTGRALDPRAIWESDPRGSLTTVLLAHDRARCETPCNLPCCPGAHVMGVEPNGDLTFTCAAQPGEWKPSELAASWLR